MKINSDIQTNADVIFGWRIQNWTVEPNRVPWDHAGNFVLPPVAASHTWLHDSIVFTPNFFKDHHAFGDVELVITAAITTTVSWPVGNDHKRCVLTFKILRYYPWSFFWIIDVHLCELSSLVPSCLHWIKFVFNPLRFDLWSWSIVSHFYFK